MRRRTRRCGVSTSERSAQGGLTGPDRRPHSMPRATCPRPTCLGAGRRASCRAALEGQHLREQQQPKAVLGSS
eukprot:8969031-Alexandrium_andersonii.AAC.1